MASHSFRRSSSIRSSTALTRRDEEIMSCINVNSSYLVLISSNIRAVLLTTLLLLVTIYIYKLKKIYHVFHAMGLSGPVPRFFLGNSMELFTHGKHSAACLAEWTKVYGKIYGYFIGHTPIICVSDPDILQEIFITKFSHFHSRRPLPLQQHDLRHLLASSGKCERFVQHSRCVLSRGNLSSSTGSISDRIHRVWFLLFQELSFPN